LLSLCSLACLLTTRVAFSSQRPRPQHSKATIDRNGPQRIFSSLGPEMTVGDISFRLSFFFASLNLFSSSIYLFIYIFFKLNI
jgi:hypothetical protein